MSTIRKKQIFIALKFQTLKNAKFCSSAIKWVYSILLLYIPIPDLHRAGHSDRVYIL